MRKVSREQIVIIFLWCAAVFFLCWRGYPFFIQDLPLGYDPGMYKVMIEKYTALTVRDRTRLPIWMQRMYPPFLGMMTGLLSRMGLSSDWFVTRGIYIAGLLPGLGMYTLIKGYTKKHVFGLLGLVLVRGSFVQRSVMWWAYAKQLVAMFFLFVVLALWVRKKRRAMAFVLAALLLTHRAGAVMILLLLLVWCVWYFIHTLRFTRKGGDELGFVLPTAITSLILAVPIYRPLLYMQFGSLWERVVRTSIDLPDYTDTYQTAGTFLTTSELLYTNWRILLIGFTGALLLLHRIRREYQYVLVLSGFCVSTLWVFGQGFFFQRMIPYADLFRIATSVLALAFLIEKKRVRYICIIILIVGHGRQMWRFSTRVWYPIIHPAEFAFLDKITNITPENAVLIVPQTMYTPWVMGWSGREIIAPGSFSLGTRGNVGGERKEMRRQQDIAGKCDALAMSYAQIERPLYVREGNKDVYIDDVPVSNNIREENCFRLVEEDRSVDVRLRSIEF